MKQIRICKLYENKKKIWKHLKNTEIYVMILTRDIF